ncbi:ATP-binding protein [Bacillus mesophilum]|uniref:ATP-binding protein n=1 Tax=Bacillus mesophilum TaxID=1071718 RepID=A0A7V7RK24_9BACI|nr:ATP-binding protein [Bacillus mesophilum]KAB2331377.1 ATP-binding protein [Bacillus mesophilum]
MLVSEQKFLSSKKKLNQLKGLTWIEQLYHVILIGPPGVGKTHLSIGLGIEALIKDIKSASRPWETNPFIKNRRDYEEIENQNEMKRISEADLVIIDDLIVLLITLFA